MGVRHDGRAPAGAWLTALAAGAALLGGAPAAAAAADPDGGLVAGLRATGSEVTPLGRTGLLEGWLVTPRGRRPYTLYVDASGHGVMGLLFAPDGRDLTHGQVAAADEAAGAAPVAASRAAPMTAPSRPAPPTAPSRIMPPPTASSRAAPPTASSRAAPATAPSRITPPTASSRAAPATAPSRITPPTASSRITPAAPARLAGPGAAVPAGVFEASLAGAGFDLGETGPEVAIFADPGCLPSRAAVAELARRALDGEIRLRVAPVAARGAGSEALAGLVLGAREQDRARTWFTLGRDGASGAIAASGAASATGATPAALADVALNRRLFGRTGAAFVPHAMLRGPDGRVTAAAGADFTAWFGR